MADENTGAAGATPAPGAMPGDTDAQEAATADQAQAQDQQQPELGDAGKAAIEREREARREAERQLKELQQQQAADKPLSEQLAALQQELAAEKAQRQEQSLRLATVSTATRLGFRNPDVAYRLLDAKAIEHGEDGTPANVEKLLTDIAKAEPYLLTANDFGGGQAGGTPGGYGNDMNTIIRRAAGRA